MKIVIADDHHVVRKGLRFSLPPRMILKSSEKLQLD